jgi:hypothetical protein
LDNYEIEIDDSVVFKRRVQVFEQVASPACPEDHQYPMRVSFDPFGKGKGDLLADAILNAAVSCTRGGLRIKQPRQDADRKELMFRKDGLGVFGASQDYRTTNIGSGRHRCTDGP